jgi:hypothetical protein
LTSEALPCFGSDLASICATQREGVGGQILNHNLFSYLDDRSCHYAAGLITISQTETKISFRLILCDFFKANRREAVVWPVDRSKTMSNDTENKIVSQCRD